MSELSEKLRSAYGAEEYDRIKTGYSSERPVSLRINSLRIGLQEADAQLAAAGFCASHVAWYDCARVLRGASEEDLRRTDLYREGKIYLQSLSSMLPPLFLQPAAGENVLDMTAAPGGKTTQLLALSGGKALITACERDKIRFERMKFNLERQGAGRVLALCKDASELDDALSFDKILLDAPCTGSGTVTPASSTRYSGQFLEKCVRRQEKLLQKAFRLLKKGGELVYSTCSVLPEENGLQVERFLRTTGAKLLKIDPIEGIPRLPSPEGTLCVCPSGDFEGFFVAKFTK